MPWLKEIGHPRRHRRLPVVLTVDEVGRVLQGLTGEHLLLALLLLGLHDEDRAWKSFDWDAMGRLHAKGLISNPVGKAKSVALSQEGLNQAQALLQLLFGAAK